MRQKVKQLKEDVKNAPLRVKIVVVLVSLYLLSPIDLIPDFIPVIGQMDDILLLSWLIYYVRKNVHDRTL
jgi:uncharacterized membrane protein YkvA (DUF1232 family)